VTAFLIAVKDTITDEQRRQYEATHDGVSLETALQESPEGVKSWVMAQLSEANAGHCYSAQPPTLCGFGRSKELPSQRDWLKLLLR
jgi:hypothetical protein